MRASFNATANPINTPPEPLTNMPKKIDFKTINESTDLVRLIGAAVPLKKQGAEYKGICPFHDDKKASLGVRPDKQLWKCQACGARYTFTAKI